MRRLLVLALCLVAACGGGGDDSASSKDTTTTTAASSSGDLSCPDEQTIGDIAGAPAEAPKRSPLPDGLQCTYSVEDRAKAIFGVVNLRYYDEDTAGALDIFQNVADDEVQVTDVAVGDEAWWSPAHTDLFVVSGGVAVDVLLSGLGAGDDARAIAIALAKPALG